MAKCVYNKNYQTKNATKDKEKKYVLAARSKIIRQRGRCISQLGPTHVTRDKVLRGNHETVQ